MKETYPLQWPKDVPRTRIPDREERKIWNKKTERQALDALEKELKQFGGFGMVVTRKDPSDKMTAPDPSVAVYFSRTSEDDFAWQDALGITNPAPTLDEISRAHRELAKRYHPDVSREDAENMVLLNMYKDNAIRYVKQASGELSTFCMPCDKFVEFRQNVTAIRNTIHSFRQMERDGTPRMVERALSGFQAALPEGKNVVATSA
jgi:hypothetical protein